jgi:hypothetical protein
MSLRFRIAESLPRDSVSLRALLSIARIEETGRVPTACVTFGAQPTLMINPAFVAQHATTAEKLQALVGHELLHVALGHTRRYAQCTPMDNLVFDCLINAMLCKADPIPERTALFRDFYSDAAFPQCFLRPPDDWHPRERVRLPAALKRADFEGLAFVKDVYRKLWGSLGASAWEIREAIRVGAKGLGLEVTVITGEVPLLGGHDHDQSVLVNNSITQELLRNITGEIARKLGGMPVEPGVDASELFSQSQIAPKKVSARAQLRTLFAQLAHGRGTARIGRDSTREVLHTTPVPSRDRRAVVQRMLGVQPMLYQAPSLQRRQQLSERIHVYLDVSGSMAGVTASLYGAMLDCRDWIDPCVHLFSGEVKDITPAQLSAGLVHTTGGTSIECVTQHMHKHRVTHALIVTDGMVGRPSNAAADVLRQSQVAVAFFGSTVSEQILAPFARATARLAV